MTATWWQSFVKQIPALVMFLALLAAATVLGYTGHIDPTNTFAVLLALTGAVGIAGFAILLSAGTPNSTLVAHGIFVLALFAAVVILALHNVFDSTEVIPFFTLVLVGAGGGVGVNALTQTTAAAATNGAMKVQGSTASVPTVAPPQ
jgi:hypothetical protein